jgi:ABC-type sugar transport system ATPase subunit
MEREPLIELKKIRKEFPGVVALDDVSMAIYAASVHALVGENGAGKSTLMKILSGTYSSYDGEIIHKGRTITLHSTKDAFDRGISIVSQELNFFPNLTIAESLFLGREPKKAPGVINFKERLALTKKWLSFMNLNYNPNSKVGALSIGQKQMLEILKAVSRNCKIIIMDEPTSALTNIETRSLFEKIQELKKAGIAFVFISHRLDEIFEICDEYTVLRDGKFIAGGAIGDVHREDLIKMMVGRELQDIYPEIPPLKNETPPPVLNVQNLSRAGFFSGVNFHVNRGEILGFAGMMGAGRSEIVRAVFGLDHRQSGNIMINGKDRQIRNIRDAIKSGIVMVPEDRGAFGFVGVRSIKDNMILPNLDIYSRFGIVRGPVLQNDVKAMASRLEIKAPGMETVVRTLSGGNQQKVVLGKWLLRKVDVLILDEPTRGIDVGTKQEIYKLIVKLASQGIAIILISSDMPEVLAMSHRILVIANGKIAGELERGRCDITQDQIMNIIVEAGGKQ